MAGAKTLEGTTIQTHDAFFEFCAKSRVVKSRLDVLALFGHEGGFAFGANASGDLIIRSVSRTGTAY